MCCRVLGEGRIILLLVLLILPSGANNTYQTFLAGVWKCWGKPCKGRWFSGSCIIAQYGSVPSSELRKTGREAEGEVEAKSETTRGQTNGWIPVSMTLTTS